MKKTDITTYSPIRLLLKDESKNMPRKEDFTKALDKVEKSVERASRWGLSENPKPPQQK